MPSTDRKKNKPEPAPNLLEDPKFPEPGTDATEADDRNLLQEATQEEVDQEVEEAEKVLDGQAPAPEPSKPRRASKKKDPAPNADELLDLAASVTKTSKRSEMEQLLQSILLLAPEHSRIARAAGQAGLAADFTTLENAAKHIVKRATASNFSYTGAA